MSRSSALAFIAFIVVWPAGGAGAGEKSREDWKAEYVRPTEIPYPAQNPYSPDKARLGQMLFFDPRLSGSNRISCATCHNPGFSWGDGLALGFGETMQRLTRRTPTLLNVAWTELLMWDGRFDSLEQQALVPIAEETEMNQPLAQLTEELQALPGYRSMFERAFPGEGITLENMAKALATFERTLISGTAPFDDWIAGDEAAIPQPAKRGFDLFNGKANCAACHSGWNFTDGSFHDLGLAGEDLGRGKLLPKIVLMQHAFKTPTLRNSQWSYPYMHDGSLADLPAVIRHYNLGGIERPSRSEEMRPLMLSDQEQADLLAFILTLSSQNEPMQVPLLPR